MHLDLLHAVAVAVVAMVVIQIAQATGVNAETAKSRLRYAVKKLRQALGEAS